MLSESHCKYPAVGNSNICTLLVLYGFLLSHAYRKAANDERGNEPLTALRMRKSLRICSCQRCSARSLQSLMFLERVRGLYSLYTTAVRGQCMWICLELMPHSTSVSCNGLSRCVDAELLRIRYMPLALVVLESCFVRASHTESGSLTNCNLSLAAAELLERPRERMDKALLAKFDTLLQSQYHTRPVRLMMRTLTTYLISGSFKR